MQWQLAITADLMSTIISKLYTIGYYVCAMVSDLGGKNQSLWKTLGINERNNFFLHPSDKSKKVFVFAGIPHMRNHVIDEGIQLPGGTVINKATFQELIGKNERELKLCPKLSTSLVEVIGSQRMKVKYAVHLFSAHSAALALHCFPEKPEISEFVSLINSLFDIFNSRIPKDGNNSAFGLDFNKQICLLNQGIQVFQSFRGLTKSNATRKTLIWFQKGFLVSIRSLIDLYTILKKDYSVTYILTSRLNQDALEKFFSLIRSMGSRSTNLTH